MSLSASRSSLRVWASSVLTKPHSRLSRSSASWVPSGPTPWLRMRKDSATAASASSASQTSRVSNSPRSGAAPNSAALSQIVAVTHCASVSAVSMMSIAFMTISFRFLPRQRYAPK